MKAEVLWTLNTIAKHQSYNGNEGISRAFQTHVPRFRYSDPPLLVVPTKRRTLAKFGLAVHIKEELVSKVNKSAVRSDV